MSAIRAKSGEDTERASRAFHIRQFVPSADGEELDHRIALLTARDFAASVRGRATARAAYNHACCAHEVAGEFIYSDAPAARLELAVKYCRHLVQAAFLAEQLEFDGGGNE